MAKENKTEEVKETAEAKKGSKNLIVIIVVVVAVLIGLTLLGRYIAKKVAEKAAGAFLSKVTGQNVNVGNNGGNITVKTDQGNLTINSGGSLPDSFPKDFPIYPGAKLTGSFSTNGTTGDNTKGVSVVWETSDDAAKVGAYFKTQLPAAGYTVTTDFSQADSTTLTFEKGTVSGFLGVTKGSDGKTAISVTIGSK